MLDRGWRRRQRSVEQHTSLLPFLTSLGQSREVDEVIIPSKLDIHGRRYGFVRFLNVKDEDLLVTKVGQFILRQSGVFIILLRFQRRQGRENAKRAWQHRDGTKPKSDFNTNHRQSKYTSDQSKKRNKDGMMYAHALKSNISHYTHSQARQYAGNHEFAHLELNVEDEGELSGLSRAYFG